MGQPGSAAKEAERAATQPFIRVAIFCCVGRPCRRRGMTSSFAECMAVPLRLQRLPTGTAWIVPLAPSLGSPAPGLRGAQASGWAHTLLTAPGVSAPGLSLRDLLSPMYSLSDEE